ncbi:hypothetical protein BHM03_00058094, partial [Ensete ventricosum]
RRKPLQGAAAHGHGQLPCRGDWLATCKGVVGCSQDPHAKGRPAASRANRQGGNARRGQTVGAAARGRPAATRHPQGAVAVYGHSVGAAANGLQTAARGQPARCAECGFNARRKAASGQRQRSQGLLPARATASMPTVGVAAPWQSGCRRARVAAACTGATAAAVTQ